MNTTESSLTAVRLASETLHSFAGFFGFDLEGLRVEELFTPEAKEVQDGTFRICLSYLDNEDSLLHMRRRIYKTFIVKDNEIISIYDGLAHECDEQKQED